MLKLFSTIQVAKLLGISRIAVYKKIKAGKIQAHRFGRNYLVEKGELLTHIRASLKKRHPKKEHSQSAPPVTRMPRKLLRNVDTIH